jgi:type VI secretion system Hcp family effector
LSIYLCVPGILGDVTDIVYEDWVKCQSLMWGVARKTLTDPGRVTSRNVGAPQFSSVTIKKAIDRSSSELFTQLCLARCSSDLRIHVCQTREQTRPYLQYELGGVFITELMHEVVQQRNDIVLLETLVIEFNQMELSYLSRNEKNEFFDKHSAGYNTNTLDMF